VTTLHTTPPQTSTPTPAAPGGLRWNALLVVGRRELVAAFRGFGIYVAATGALVALGWSLLGHVRAVRNAGLLVHADPFATPLAYAIIVLTLFLALSAVVSAARDRERGTLEVLFYGPVDELSYITAKIGGQVAAYVLMLPVLLVTVLILGAMTGFLVSGRILLTLGVSIIPAVQIVAFGVLLSVATSRVRTAIALFAGIIVVLLGVSLAYAMILLVPLENPNSPLLPVRDGLAAANAIVSWVSPLSYVERIVDSSLTGARREALTSLGAALAYALGTVTVATLVLRRRGVHRKGE
jgi:ABC-type transport system involved in multi-copper enzyme maturation permease subunit